METRKRGIRVILVAILVLLGISVLLEMGKSSPRDYTRAQFKQDIKDDLISEVEIIPNEQTPSGRLEIAFRDGSSKVLYVADVEEMEDLLEAEKDEYRSAFETFKSNTCHRVKDMGDIDFMMSILEKDEIRLLFDKHWYPESLYLLAMLDYLSRINDIPICTKYDDIRKTKLSRPIYPIGAVITDNIMSSDEAIKKAKAESIPEFARFNIYESDIRNVV